MYRLTITAANELRQLLRDRSGLLMLFVMPALLVVVITLVQQNVMATVSDQPAAILVADLDGGDLGRAIRDSLRTADGLRLVEALDGAALTDARIREAVAAGRNQAGLVIPAGLTAGMRAAARTQAQDMLQDIATDAPPSDPLRLTLYFDPLAGGAYRSAVIQALQRLLAGIEVRERLTAISAALPEALARSLETALGPRAAQGAREQLAALNLSLPAESLLAVRAQSTGRGGFDRLPTAVQQNVPAWTLFGMFFTLVPLAGSLVRERASGIDLRLRILPVSSLTLLTGKMAAYVAICLAQFGLILFIGRFGMPLLGAESLEVGTAYGSILIVALAAALAATGAGMLLGVVARTYAQATMVGALSVVIAAAIGGVMVPVFAMPSAMQAVSCISPLAWGLEAFLVLFVRGGGLDAVWPQLALLLSFALATLMTAVMFGRHRS
jgi:ABC-2 type transport system permease protein